MNNDNLSMKSLEQHNKERLELWRGSTDSLDLPSPNGIACPKCGAELLDTRPREMLASHPPKKSVRCSKCVYSGYRLA